MVVIDDVTITGGVTRSSPDGSFVALGGGVSVPPAANYGPGATVAIVRSIVSDNLAAPATAVDAGLSCGAADCMFAHAGGGGIDSWGNLTLRDSVVADNRAAGSVTSDANGAGIYAQQGSLLVDHSLVSGNDAVAAVPDGRFAGRDDAQRFRCAERVVPLPGRRRYWSGSAGRACGEGRGSRRTERRAAGVRAAPRTTSCRAER